MNTLPKIAGIIPARYASSRFPGKPLALIGDKTMIRLVYEQASKALDNVFVATDDDRIFNEVNEFGGKVIMTSSTLRSGTDRCAEAANKIRSGVYDAEILINIQGDEPFIDPEQILSLAGCFDDEEVKIATLIRQVNADEDLFNPNQPKVVIDNKGFALYFSRAAIPYIRDSAQAEWSSRHVFFKHIGLYAYRAEVLQELSKLTPGKLESAESLEQNRWLENGYRIKTVLTTHENFGIDTPDDLEKAMLIRNSI